MSFMLCLVSDGLTLACRTHKLGPIIKLVRVVIILSQRIVQRHDAPGVAGQACVMGLHTTLSQKSKADNVCIRYCAIEVLLSGREPKYIATRLVIVLLLKNCELGQTLLLPDILSVQMRYGTCDPDDIALLLLSLTFSSTASPQL